MKITGVTPHLIALLLLAPLSSQRAPAGQKDPPEVRSVTFQGNSVYDEGTLEHLMVTRAPGFLSSTDFRQEVFDSDLQNVINYYHQNGYLQARVTGSIVRGDTAAHAVDILVRLYEGQVTRVDTIAIGGNRAFPDSVLLNRVGLQRGDPFLANNVQNGMMAMVSLYADSGYLSAAVHPVIEVDSAAHLATVHFRVVERAQFRVSAITVEGIQKTKESIIRRELLFEEGEVVEYSLLLESQRRLYMTGLFESVFIRPDSASDSTHKVIRVEVKEKLSGEFNVAVGYGSVEKIRGKLQMMTTNFRGTGRQLGGTVNASFIRQIAEGSFTEPWTFGTRWRTDVNLFYQLQQEPSFDSRGYGTRITVGRLLGRRSNVSLTYRLENTKITNLHVPLPADQLTPHVRSLLLTLKNDERDDPFNTTEGTYAELDNEVAGALLGGSNTFFRTELRLKWFHSFDTETTLGSSLDGGWMTSFGGSLEIPLSERFFAGGPNALRAFEYQRIGPEDDFYTPLGGNFKIIWNLAELRRTVWKFVGAVAFIDVGQVWNNLREFRVSDLRIAAGPGLRVNTPIGMIRLDWGLNIFPQEHEGRSHFYFNMGQAF